MSTRVIEVFADVACPFTHVGLRRIAAYRRSRQLTEPPTLRVRAWPLEWVNGKPLQGSALAPKVAALRAGVASDLFEGFNEARFPATTVPALIAEAAAYRVGLEIGERFSFAVRTALFENGLDVSSPEVLRELRDDSGVPSPTPPDELAVEADFGDGKQRGVTGSPYFFTSAGGFFCPSLDIRGHGPELNVSFDVEGFQKFVEAAFD